MKIERVKPLFIKPKPVHTPQCTTEVPANDHHSEWRKGRYKQIRPHMDPLRCQREATVTLNGEPYCSAHAGRIALMRWLRGELVEK